VTLSPPRCTHNAHPDMCPFCKTDQELEEHPELAAPKQRPHEFGCPLFESLSWSEVQRANYKRIYSGGSGGTEGTECTCKPEPEKGDLR